MNANAESTLNMTADPRVIVCDNPVSEKTNYYTGVILENLARKHPHAVQDINDRAAECHARITDGAAPHPQDQALNLVWYVGMRQTDPTWVEENRGPAWSSHPILIEPEQLPGPIAPASCKEGPTRKGRRSHRRYRWKENRDL